MEQEHDFGKFELRKKTLGQLLDEAVARCPDNDAVVYVDRDFRQTWAELSNTVDQMAKGLMALGVQKGEKVAIWATNVPYWVNLMFATARIGASLLTVNTSYRESELEYLLTNSECENFFTIDGYRDHDYIQTLYKVVPELREHPRGQLRCEKLPHLKRVMFLGMEKHRGMYSLPELFAMSAMISDEEYEARKAQVDPDDVTNMQYTSGTTGFPKGVQLTHTNIGLNGYWIGKHMAYGPKDRICLPVPLFHCFGCSLGVMAAVNHCCAMIFVETFNPVQVLTAIESEGCTSLYGVPTMFIALMEHKLFPKFSMKTLRTGIMAGSVCPEPLMQKAIDLMYMTELTTVYGLTESSPGMTQTNIYTPFKRKTSTVGKPLPGVEVRIVDPDTMEEKPRGVPGEVVCRGYNVMKGYYNMPEATLATVTPDGWLHSGDLGIMDEEGYISITGRIKDMIIRGGENIYPKELEEFLSHMDGVSDVQVVAVPSRKYGEEVGAFIITKPEYDLAPEDVRDHCRGKIAWHKVPKYIAFVEEFPLTASGKVLKYKLREMASELFPDAMK